MYTFNSIKELLNALALGKELLGEMFGKRKSFSYRYDQAIELMDEAKVNALIEKGILTQNGRYLEIDDQLLSFFEQVLDVNEEISIALINEQLTVLKENIDYYLAEDSEHRKYKYLRNIKGTLRKLGHICLRNIVDLNRHIDHAFKTEPNYKIKIKKLAYSDQRRHDIKQLIAQTENLLSADELTFFATAKDDELTIITTELRLQLQESRHNLIETEKQIIDFLNQVKHQSKVIEKIRQVKYLKDQFELESKSDILHQLTRLDAISFEKRPMNSIKIDLDILSDDDVYASIQTLHEKIKTNVIKQVPIAKAIEASFFDDTEEANVFVDLELMKNSFSASSYCLHDFILRYDYPMKVSFEDMVTCYCQILSQYEDDLRVTDEYVKYQDTEFLVVLPK